ncbi:hypothetical protein BUALT_Bualt11G0027900 [Buddleja alternifolia]|uniref:GTD-binding domain-containing protein n=1 Tax=Buddleja alternifolia TaxID=168488 RepID=A0AAV6WTD7_9LAMI|nr:hypothetical protein BUALT_Bualt11G0027900 [Buddleja alternifolia]
MKTNKFAKMLHKNNHKIVVILVYAILEWILIFLLLLNSLFSHLITKFAKHFGLKPPCIWCSRVNFFDSKKNENSNILDHICEAHRTDISKLSYCSDLQMLSESNNLCNNCFSSISSPTRNEKINDDNDDDDPVIFENKNQINCYDEDESVYIADMLLHNADYVDYSDRFICIEMIEEESSILTDDQYKAQDEDNEKCAELCVIDSPKIEDHGSNDQDSIISEMEVADESPTIEHLKTTIQAQEKALNALYAELEEERKAAAVSTDETMAMITKIQQEKAAIQMEALQYQRMMEEQSEYDQEALQFLNNLMIKREKENQQLQKELEIYRNRDKLISHISCKSNDDFSIDLDSEGEEHIDFDEERVCIIERLKSLESLFDASCDDLMAERLLTLFNDEIGEGNLDEIPLLDEE